MSQNRILVPVGEPILPGDELWDSDFETWEMVTSSSFNKPVGPKDVVRRTEFDLSGLLKSVLIQVEKLRSEPLDANWWHYTDTYIAEAKRRIGLRSYEGVTENGVCIPAVVEKSTDDIAKRLSEDLDRFRQRNQTRRKQKT